MSAEDNHDSIEMHLHPMGTAGGEQSRFADSSGPFFNMYRTMAENADRKDAERWQKDAESVILFSTLFSAAVATLVAVTLPDLYKPTPAQDSSAIYLAGIYQLLATPNDTDPPYLLSDPFDLLGDQPDFLLWVYSLWLLSLAISLTCAMLATLLQQWLRRYLAISQPPPYSPHDRARRRTFFARGVKKWRLTWWLEALPTLLHLSFFVFFTGLLILSSNSNHPVFMAIVWWIGLSGAVYLSITIMPLFWTDIPYFTPLSSIFGLLRHVEKEAGKAVERQASVIDSWALQWMLESVTEDRELGQFFDTVPGFCHSNREVVTNPQSSLDSLGDRLTSALLAFAKHTLSSDVVAQCGRIERLIVTVKVADAAHLSKPALEVLKGIFPLDRDGVLQDEAVWHSLGEGDNASNTAIGLCAQSIIAGIIANVQEQNGRWIAFATDQLGGDLPDYVNHGKESVLLANLVHITSQIFDSSLGDSRNMADAASYILPSLSNFDIQNTLPELQDDFLDLWKKISRTENNDIAKEIRKNLRHLHEALGQGSGASPTEPSVPTAEPGSQSAPTTGATRDGGGPGPGPISRIASASVSDRDPPGNIA